VPTNRSIIILTTSLAVLLGTACGIQFGTHPPSPKPIPAKQFQYQYRFLLPENYIGWVRIDVGVRKAQRWEFEQDNTVTATIPESGVKQTESGLFETAEVLLYYQRAGDLVPVPDEMYTHFVGASGVKVTRKNGRWGPTKGSWYFFVGPRTLKGDYPFSVAPNSHDPVPAPGRIAAPPPETQHELESNQPKN
jgi:hypothetical protein